MLRHAEEYQQWISEEELDVFHATAPFHFERPVLIDFDVCPMVASFYDLIPLIFPAHYLSGWWREQYLRTAAFLSKAGRMIAISHAAKSDATTFLGFPPARIDVAWPIPDDCFRPLPEEALTTSLERLRSRIRVPERYVLTVSHLHHTKNLQTLLHGYSLLPAALRSDLPLVVACHLDAGAAAYLGERAEHLGIADDVVMTGLTSDDELAVLYNAATLVVHPSRYEGFGLPVIEAMRCGTPVITTTASSLPEAGGDAALLVDPDDVLDLARAIEALIADPGRRRQMADAGLVHSARFDSEQLGRRTLDSYRALIDQVAQPAPARPRLAVWTPLPPQQSGIADYSVELLRELRGPYDIEVFVDDDCVPPASLLFQCRIHHFTAFGRRHAQQPFDAFLYQMGGSLFHLYMYDALREFPGAVVLHDFRWGHVLYTHALYNDDFATFRRQLVELEGEEACREFDRIQQVPQPERQPLLDQFLVEHRMFKDILERSLALIVHLHESAAELERSYPQGKVATIPMGVSDPYLRHGFDPLGVRHKVGAGTSTFLIGTFGIVHPTKGIETCIRALAELSAGHPDALLIIVGRALEEGYLHQIRDLAEELGVLANIRFLGHVTRAAFDEYMMACDVVVNLRSFTKETHMSATLIRAIAAGKPLIMSDLPEWCDIPDEIGLRVPYGADERAVLVRHLRRLAGDPELRRSMSVSARHYFKAEGTAQRMAARYVAVLDSVSPSARSAAPFDRDEPLRSDRRVNDLPFNKLCEIEDFSHPELAATIRDVCEHKLAQLPAGYPNGVEHRKDWEVGMAVRALRQFGALRPDAIILGVAAGAEDTLFYLTRHARQVFATDRYLASGEWEPTAPLSMLVAPQDVAPFEFDMNRLVVQHMDGRSLHYPDDTFDGIFSSGSIEHFGDLLDVAHAAYEMGRVLKPGGVLSLSTEFRIGGPPGGVGWPGLTLLFSAENLRRFVIEASGLEPVDDLRAEVSEATLGTPRDLTLAIEAHLRQSALAASGDHRDTYAEWDFPHVLLVHEGYVFTSVHLTLRKTEGYPAVPNAWAKPSQDVLDAVAAYNRGLVQEKAEAVRQAAASAPVAASEQVAAYSPPGSWDEHRVAVRDCLSKMSQRLHEIDAMFPDLDRFLSDAAALDLHGTDVAGLAELVGHHRRDLDGWMEQLAARRPLSLNGADLASPQPQDDWTCSSVTLKEGVQFDIVVDTRLGDQVTAALAMGWTVDQPLLSLMLELVSPGERMLDLGAHVGTFSLAAAAVGVHALAVEASPENVAMLRASVTRNGFHNVRVIQAVASDQPGRSRFHSHGPWGQVAPDGSPDDTVTVTALPLDDLVRELNWQPLGFVKIDVEGWEPQVLDGMRGILSGPQAPPLLYECNGHTLVAYGTSPEELISLVASFGYTSYLVDDGRLVRVGAQEFQPQTLVDYLAVKVPPSLLLEGWTVENEMTLDERDARIVADCTHSNPNQRLYMARALERAGVDILGRSAVMEAVEALRSDPAEEVRAAVASWSPGPGQTRGDDRP